MKNKLSAIESIRAISSELSPKQKLLVSFIIQNMERAAFMNSVDLGEAASVSNSTVIRLASRLGYDGFPDLQRALQQDLRAQYSTLQRFSPNGRGTETSLVKKVFSLEYEVLTEMQSKISEENILEAVDLIRKCDDLYIIGLLANTCLAEYAAYFLGILRKKVHLITTPQHHIFNALKEGNRRSAALIYSFPRYPRETQHITEYLKHKGVAIIGMTDSPLSPLGPLCDILFEVPMKFITFIDPCAAAFALSHCLLSVLYLQDLSQSRKNLESFETFAGQRRYFQRNDIDIVDLM